MAGRTGRRPRFTSNFGHGGAQTPPGEGYATLPVAADGEGDLDPRLPGEGPGSWWRHTGTMGLYESTFPCPLLRRDRPAATRRLAAQLELTTASKGRACTSDRHSRSSTLFRI
jgi:hypothetical protein